jgi:hypothetical protein
VDRHGGDWLAEAAALEGVPSALAAARDGIDALLRDRGHRRVSARDTSESLLRGAVASARLAGSSSSLDGVRAGGGDEIVRRALRLNASLLGLAPVLVRSPAQALARLHTLASAGVIPAPELGRPRTDANAAGTLRALSEGLLASTAVPAIAVACLAHAEIAVNAPFHEGNGLVGRALERLILASRGVDPLSVTVPEAGHATADAEYDAALSAYRSGGRAGRRIWLLYAASALGRAVRESPLYVG